MVVSNPPTNLQPPVALFTRPPAAQTLQSPASQSPLPPTLHHPQPPPAQSSQPPAVHSLPPIVSSPGRPSTKPSPIVSTPVQTAPQQPAQLAARLPGRPPKKRIFNFSKHAPALQSPQPFPDESLQLLPALSPHPSTDHTPVERMPCLDLSSPPSDKQPALMGDTTTLASSRPRRVKKEPNWFGDRVPK